MSCEYNSLFPRNGRRLQSTLFVYLNWFCGRSVRWDVCGEGDETCSLVFPALRIEPMSQGREADTLPQRHRVTATHLSFFSKSVPHKSFILSPFLVSHHCVKGRELTTSVPSKFITQLLAQCTAVLLLLCSVRKRDTIL